MNLEFTVSVEVSFVTGKFAGQDELIEQIQEALDSANPETLEGSNGGEYTIDEWSVSPVEKPKPVKRPKRRISGAEGLVAIGKVIAAADDEPSQGALRPAIERLPGTLVKERVTVVWRDAPQARYLNVLTYTPEGTIRTYTRDGIDPRITIHAEAKTKDEAIDFLRAGDGKHLLVPVAIAKQLGDSSWEFDQ